jgi:hypothetical protein
MKSVNVKFRVINGKIHVKNLHLNSEDYSHVASQLLKLVEQKSLENHNFTSTVNIPLKSLAV